MTSVIRVALIFCCLVCFSHRPVRAEEDYCRLYQRVMNNLGVSMSRYRYLISSTDDPQIIDAATVELERYTSEYRRVKRQFSQDRCQGWSRN